jgi:hypothetical protein
MRAALLPLMLTACGPGGVWTPQGSVQTGSPILTARSGATTALTIIACPTTGPQVNALQETINMLSAHGLLVTADEGGNARLVINACPAGFPSADQLRAMGENQRARGTR